PAASTVPSARRATVCRRPAARTDRGKAGKKALRVKTLLRIMTRSVPESCISFFEFGRKRAFDPEYDACFPVHEPPCFLVGEKKCMKSVSFAPERMPRASHFITCLHKKNTTPPSAFGRRIRGVHLLHQVIYCHR